MKKLLIALFVMGTMTATNAQIKTPSASPSATIMQSVGLTDVEISYSRPSVKGRTIFAADGLVPYGKIWRTGANSVTKMTFSQDVNIGGEDLKAGSYGVLSMPNAGAWAVHFYNYESSRWSSYVEKQPAAIVKAKPAKSTHKAESFTISVDDLTDNGATINIAWDMTRVPLKLMVHTDKQAMASIDKLLAGPSKGEYYNMASYFHTSGKDLNKALEFINLATDGDDKKFWQVRRKALILADLGKTKDAIKAAKMSLELATAAGNDDYIAMNKKSIAEWSK